MEADTGSVTATSDTSSSPSTGFRHQLPQIASLAYNPNIAQSKATAKSVAVVSQNVDGAIENTRSDEVVTLYGATDTPDKKQDKIDDKSSRSKKNARSKDTPVSRNKSQRKSSKPTKLSQNKNDCNSQLDSTLDTSSTADEMSPNINTDKSTMDPADLKLPFRKRGRKPKIIHEPGEGLLSTAVTSQTVSSSGKSSAVAIEEIPVKFSLGELFWARVSGHPWWPCMVSYYPYEAIFTRMGAATTRTYRTYHVQFFGDENERGWIRETALIRFEGREKLEEYFSSLGKKGKGSNMQLEVAPRRRAAWEIALQAAMEALPLTIDERKEKYSVLFEPNVADPEESEKVGESGEEAATGITRTKAKLKMALKTARTSRLHGQPGSSPAPHSDSANESSDVVATADDEYVGRTRKRRGTSEGSPSKRKYRRSDEKSHGSRAVVSAVDSASFEVFCQKHREDVQAEHPDFDDEQIQENLQQEWEDMNDKQRSRYKSRFGGSPTKQKPRGESADVVTVSGKKSSRTRHSSAKKQDADESMEQKQTSPPSQRARRTRSVEPVNLSPSHDTAPTDDTPQVDTKVETIEPVQDEGVEIKDVVSEHSEAIAPPSKLQPTGARKQSTASKANDHEMELEVMRLSTNGPVKHENLCVVCEKGGEMLTCEGPCVATYHVDCVGLKEPPAGPFHCTECTTGAHTCFICKRPGTDTKLCSVPKCGKFYHEECVNKNHYTRQDSAGFICPHHGCVTCNAVNPKLAKNNKGRLYRCVRCPNAYHVGDFCISAGSVNLPGYNIICSDHFTPLKSHAHHSHVNVAWCFLCNKGGTLLCCDSCPSAFHADCLNISSPEDKWFCPDCAAGHRPLYGDMIWVKLGNYRWWPGEICHPRNVPKNIQDKSHTVGEFPVHFLGSHEYFWLHRGRVFLFQEGDKGSKDRSNSKGLAKIFHKAVTEATEAYKQWVVLKEERDQVLNEKNDKKPAQYKYIKTNFPIGNVVIKKDDIADIPRCECKSSSDHPCGKDTRCLNRMLMYECHPATCPAGERCENQNFTRRDYPECRPHKVEGRGWGLQTLVPISKGDFVNEYVGDLIDEEECKARIAKAHLENISNFYFLTLDKNRIIDAGPKGNLSRFMNHSCQPNLETQKWWVNGDVRVGLFAKQDIPAGSELTFNYNLECLGNEKTKCQCQAPNCSGFLGVRPRVLAKGNGAPKEVKKKRRKKVDVKKDHDDSCFRCSEGGELVMCDKSRCPRVYHLECLNLNKPPRGKWVCPWHHCDECGAKGDVLCSRCPNSFCSLHLKDNIYATSDGRVVCVDHDDLVAGARQATVADREDSASVNSSAMTSDSANESGDESDGDVKSAAATETQGDANGSVSRRGRPIKRKQVIDSISDIDDTPVKASATGSGKKRGRRKKNFLNTGDASRVKTAETNGDHDAAMFSDEEFPSLVIDIPNV